MKITVGQLKKLIKEQVEEAKKAGAVEKFHATLEGGGHSGHPLVDAAIAAVDEGKSPAKVVDALKMSTDDSQELMQILDLIAKSDKKVAQKLLAALDASEDRRF
jgi:hypothetical protein